MKNYKKMFLAILVILTTKLLFAQTQTSFDSKNNFLINGKPFFPFGCYGLFYTASQSDKVASVKELSKAGLNIMCLVNADNANGQTNFLNLLDTANKYKVYFIMGASNNSFLKYRASQCINKPALWGYTLADDADDGVKTTLEECSTVEAEIKAIDKNRLTHLTLTGWNSARRNQANEFIKISDFCSYQCYPIGHHRYADITPSNALAVAYQRTLAYVLEAERQNKPFVHTPQTFTWGAQSDIPRYPTVKELRNMVYTALAAGVKGFISYDFSFDLINNQKALWKEYSDLAKDMKSFHSTLLENQLTRHSTAENDLVVSSWKKGDSILVVAVNTSYSESKNLNLALANINSYKLSAVNGRLPNNLSLVGNFLKGTLAAQETYAYWLSPSPTSSENEEDKISLRMYPNPASSEIFILGEYENPVYYQIVGLDGKILVQGQTTNKVINIESLSSGYYFIKIKYDKEEMIVGWVKN